MQGAEGERWSCARCVDEGSDERDDRESLCKVEDAFGGAVWVVAREAEAGAVERCCARRCRRFLEAVEPHRPVHAHAALNGE